MYFGILLLFFLLKIFLLKFFLVFFEKKKLGDDPNWEKGYTAWGAYGQSKFANILFGYQLNEIFKQKGLKVKIKNQNIKQN